MDAYLPKDPDFVQRIHDSFASQHFMAHIGARLGAVAPGRCEIRLPFRSEITQQDQFFHGGAVGTIADVASGYAALTLMPVGARVLTVEYKLNLMKPALGRELVARGRVLRPGRTLTVCLSEVFDLDKDRETLCATVLATMYCLTEEPGADPAGG
jgi:uncharacterized protein (TIGR00369 family)